MFASLRNVCRKSQIKRDVVCKVVRQSVPNFSTMRLLVGIFKFLSKLDYFSSFQNFFFMKSRFKLLIVLYISIHKNLISHKFMLDFPDFSSIVHNEFSKSFRRSLTAILSKLSNVFSDFLCENIHTTDQQLKFE